MEVAKYNKGVLEGENPFNTILGSDILEKKDLDILRGLTQELKDVFVKSQVFRTRTEMEVSVLDDIHYPTPASKYWQSVREQNAMFTELIFLSFEYRKTKVEIEIEKNKKKKEKDKLQQELYQIEIEKKMFLLKNMEKIAKDRIRELNEWSEIKKREVENMSEQELSEVNNHQLISYTIRWINEFIAMGNSGSPSERQNLLGQLRSGILACIKNGIIDNVLENFSEEVRKKIKKEYNIIK